MQRHVAFVTILVIGAWPAPSWGQELLSPEMQALVQKKNGMTAQQLADYLPYKKYPVEPFTAYFPLIDVRGGKEVAIPSTEDPILWRQ